MKRTFMIIPIMTLLAACTTATNEPQAQTTDATLQLTSPAFAAEGIIPVQYTCTGKNTSPELNWTGAPEGTKSFALIVNDPDAPVGTWVHWVIFNIPAEMRQLPEAFGNDKELADGTRQGRNSSNAFGYQGPCPPSGTHRYYFKLYALDTTLDLAAGAKKDELLSALDSHVLAKAELMGTYSK